ncbi:hypothetical protein C9413_24565 [Rhizobium sp. SEMIA 4085]|uniref:hypothetical protein n=1 Tax=Rhizobium gallicum TaxID=56730 RepID=UPI001416FF40|nr:hypothetical protein [Rhizobium sp. SEMIA 4085]
MKEEEGDLIVAFLNSLTGKVPEVAYPVLPAETAATPQNKPPEVATEARNQH